MVVRRARAPDIVRHCWLVGLPLPRPRVAASTIPATVQVASVDQGALSVGIVTEWHGWRRAAGAVDFVLLQP